MIIIRKEDWKGHRKSILLSINAMVYMFSKRFHQKMYKILVLINQEQSNSILASIP